MSSDTAETFYGKLKSSISSPKFTLAFQKLKEAKVVDLAKKGYDIVKDELSGSPSKRKHLEYTPSPSWTGEKSTRTDLVVTPSKKSMWSKLKEKVCIFLVPYNISRYCIYVLHFMPLL